MCPLVIGRMRLTTAPIWCLFGRSVKRFHEISGIEMDRIGLGSLSTAGFHGGCDREVSYAFR